MDIKGKFLITTDNWFIAPDGEQYKAVWGECTVITAKDYLGVHPVRSTNWFVQVGNGDGAIIIAGCQIHYAVKCEKPPRVIAHTYKQETTGREVSVNSIYIPYI